MMYSTLKQISELNIASVADGEATAANISQIDLITLEILPEALRLNGSSVSDTDLAVRLSTLVTAQSQVSVTITDAVTTQRMIETLVLLNSVEGLSIQLVAPQ